MSKANLSAAPKVQPALSGATVAAPRTIEPPIARGFLKQAILFILIGLGIYLAIFALADQLLHQTTKRNRFYMVKNAPITDYDVAILGASHAAVFDYEDMNARLEQMTGQKIINLSIVGGGVTVNRLLLDYFLVQHHTKTVVYFADSFAFYSQAWNEERLQDVRLLDRAPFDPALAQVLIQSPVNRSVALDYLVGFSKINNPDRFKSDISDDEANKFAKTFRPVPQIDQQRIEYLYPKQIDANKFNRYLSEFEELINAVSQRNIRLIVMKPPVPERFYRQLPNETQFDSALANLLQRKGIPFLDYSLKGNDEKFFFNSDHLNRDGVLNFFENYFKPVLLQ